MSALWREVQVGSATTLASEREDDQCALEGPVVADTWTGQGVDGQGVLTQSTRENGQIADERKKQVGTTSAEKEKKGGANSRSPAGKCNPVLSRAAGGGERRRGSVACAGGRIEG